MMNVIHLFSFVLLIVKPSDLLPLIPRWKNSAENQILFPEPSQPHLAQNEVWGILGPILPFRKINFPWTTYPESGTNDVTAPARLYGDQIYFVQDSARKRNHFGYIRRFPAQGQNLVELRNANSTTSLPANEESKKKPIQLEGNLEETVWGENMHLTPALPVPPTFISPNVTVEVKPPSETSITFLSLFRTPNIDNDTGVPCPSNERRDHHGNCRPIRRIRYKIIPEEVV